jgi:hypothetical protein
MRADTPALSAQHGASPPPDASNTLLPCCWLRLRCCSPSQRPPGFSWRAQRETVTTGRKFSRKVGRWSISAAQHQTPCSRNTTTATTQVHLSPNAMIHLAVAASIAFWPFGGNQITRADVEKAGGQWPLTVDSIKYRCISSAAGRIAIYEFPYSNPEGKYFRLVGVKTSIPTVQLAASAKVWKSDPKIPGAKVSVGDLRNVGNARCK